MIVVGVSGGVDSSVTALLMKQSGMNIHGVFMQNWEGDNDPHCRANADRLDAVRICGALGIPFTYKNFSDVYYKEVFQTFLDDYARGVTPNPDILCNREVKFKAFLDAALEMGAEGIATGHYARKAHLGHGRYALLRGKDNGKDQSYFLHAISQKALAVSHFPVGELPKTEVRRLAQEANLITADKKDSTGICFIGERDFKEFLSQYLPSKAGNIVTEDGTVIGKHTGSMFYTIGQKAPIGGVKGFDGRPWFVIHKDVVKNELVVGQGRDHARLLVQEFVTEPISWIAGHPPSDMFEAEVQIRHLGESHPVRVKMDEDGRAHIRSSLEPIWAVAPGQAAVLYQGEVCLGGAPISLS